MTPESTFEVFWSDARYKVRPFLSLSEVYKDIKQSAQICSDSLLRSHKKNSYDLQPRSVNEDVTILRNVSGSIRSGELTAVMGPSGAGKTTLLNLIARRKEKGYSGQLHIRGSDRQLRISTIPQNDYLPPYLSVRENLLFASRLKNLEKDYDHDKVVDQVVKVLDLQRCIHTRTNKISGGQKKRVSIAQELMSKPDILILDEPTSGLDSLTCFKTLKVLKNLARSSTENSIAILLTIHQPERNVFDLFDKVYALAQGGVAIYNDSPKECSGFIKKHTGLATPYQSYNPAAFLIEIASGEYGQLPIEVLQRQVAVEARSRKESVSDTDSNSPTGKKLGKTLSGYTVDKSSPEILDIDKRLVIGSSMNSNHFWTKTMILAHRYYVSQVRDPKQLIASLVAHILLPFAFLIMMGKEAGSANGCPRLIRQISLYDMTRSDDLIKEEVITELEQTAENTATVYTSTYSILAACTGIATLSFALDMLSSLKEYHNGWYPINSYLFARILVDLPTSIIFPTICVTMTYYLTGQQVGGSITILERSMLASLATILGTIISKLFGMIFGALFMGQVITALFTSQAAFMPLVMLSGFVVRSKNMTPYLRWISQLSFLRHNMELCILARYGFNVCPCNPDDLKEVKVTGVSDHLQRVTEYYLSQVNEEDNSYVRVNETGAQANQDLFQIYAKQVSLFNTFGREIKSCDQVSPQQMYELSLTDGDYVPILAKYCFQVLVITMLLLLTVKLVVRSKTSL